jgi:hypothetical protein
MVMVDNAQSTKVVSTGDDSATGLVWESVQGVEPAAWVGRVRGIFVGMVEARWQEGFTATTRLGRKLGTFGTLESAQQAFIVKRTK